MFSHLSICATDIKAAAAFCDAAPAPLGFVRVWTDTDAVGYGPPGQSAQPLMIIEKRGAAPPGEGFHLAFDAPDRGAVDAFHAAAIANGGKDNGDRAQATLLAHLEARARRREEQAQRRITAMPMKSFTAALAVSATLMIAPGGHAQETLRDLADARGIFIGAAVAVGPFLGEDAYRATLGREFNMIVAENIFKWDSIHPSPNTYRFTQPDALVDFAVENGMAVRGHALVWHNQNPGWLVRAQPTRATAIEILRDHIHSVVGHFKGRVAAWDVVNEAIDDATGKLRTDSLWYKAIGPDYIAMAFRFAHEADPDARLYYNDYGAEGGGRKSDAVYELVKGLLAEGVPIHGVGWQMHLENGARIGADYRANATRLAGLGLEISITELDVRIMGEAGPLLLSVQADTYGDVVELCLEQPNCKAVVSWGFTDRHSWIPGFFTGWDNALIFDRDYAPKRAYDAIRAALMQK
jgi:endo-1,4-beta-xylanase